MIPAQQSPINLEAPYPTNLGTLQLTIDWQKTGCCDVTGTVTESEHGLKVSFPFDNANLIKLDDRTFVLSQFHFHFPTEHYVNGSPVSGAMELHIVHQNPHDATLAVLGVFIQPKLIKRRKKKSEGEADRGLNLLEDYLQQSRERRTARSEGHDCEDPPIEINTDACDWIPSDAGLTHYYRYEGSLTSSPYTESVSWVVFDDILKVPFDVAKWDELKRDFGHAARPIQSLNRRLILFHDDTLKVPAKAKRRANGR